MPLLPEDKPRPIFLALLGLGIGAILLLASFCYDDNGGSQERHDRTGTLAVLAALSGGALLFAGWRLFASRRFGDSSLVIARRHWNRDEVIEATIEFPTAEEITEAEIALLSGRRGYVRRSPPWTWTPAGRPGAIAVSGRCGRDCRIGFCHIVAKARTSSGRKLKARFVITVM